MIELYLSSDGKHTVHASAETPEELASLARQAQALYEAILQRYGNKAQMWQGAINGQAKTDPKIEPAGQQTQVETAPLCPVHGKPMKFRNGKFGSFWSCTVRKPDGRWCTVTKEVETSEYGEQKAN